MFKLGNIAFGDNVRIDRSEETIRSGYADLAGVCYGLTTPSATGVEVIVLAPDDQALNVHFDDGLVEDAWFSPELVLLVDRAAGSRATVGDHEFVKAADGSWVSATAAAEAAPRRRRWFRRS